jgi:hypothetical protein
MRKFIAYTALICLPFMVMVAINELNRPEKKFDIKYLKKNGKAYNSDKLETGKCTWRCHNDGCASGHFSKMSVLNIPLIKWMNEGIKDLNQKGSRNYSRMNIATLVIIWPLLMFALLVINIELFNKRRNKL